MRLNDVFLDDRCACGFAQICSNNSMAKLTEQLDGAIHIAATEMPNIEHCADKKTKVMQPAFVV